MNQTDFARTQADGLDNIAPTISQGQAAWQYAQSDNFFSPEEQAAVMRRQLEPYRDQLEGKLTQLGFPPEHLAQHPAIKNALYSGQQTDPITIIVGQGIKLEGSLRVVMTEQGPDLRITPIQRELTIPQQIGDIMLSRDERQHLAKEGSLPRPFLTPENGEYIPTYLRVDPITNTVELWKVKADQLPTKLMGIDLTKDQQVLLAHGHSVKLSGLIDQQGEPFNATVSLSASKQSIQFSDLSRLDVSIKPASEFRQQLAQNNEGAKTDLTRSREVGVGSPVISNQQSEAIKSLLDSDPHQHEKSLKPRR